MSERLKYFLVMNERLKAFDEIKNTKLKAFSEIKDAWPPKDEIVVVKTLSGDGGDNILIMDSNRLQPECKCENTSVFVAYKDALVENLHPFSDIDRWILVPDLKISKDKDDSELA